EGVIRWAIQRRSPSTSPVLSLSKGSGRRCRAHPQEAATALSAPPNARRDRSGETDHEHRTLALSAPPKAQRGCSEETDHEHRTVALSVAPNAQRPARSRRAASVQPPSLPVDARERPARCLAHHLACVARQRCQYLTRRSISRSSERV